MALSGSQEAGPSRGAARVLRGCVKWKSEGYGHGGPGVCMGDGQTEAYLKDMGIAGLASAWAMARRRPI